MAQKGKVVKESIDNDFDFDNDLDMGEFSFDMEEPVDDRNPVTKASGAAVEGFVTGAFDSQFLKDQLRDTLPEGYGQTMDMGDRIGETIGKTFDDSVKAAKPAVKEFKRSMMKVLPADSKYMPGFMKDVYEEWKDDIKGTSNGEIDIAQQREDMLGNQLGSIFNAQFQQADQMRKEDDARGYVEEAVDQARHKESMGSSNEQVQILSRMDQYLRTVNLEWQKKSLELQYRQLFVAQDNLKISQELAKGTLDVLPVLVKNTGLPEFVKQKGPEFLAEYQKRKMAESIGRGLFGNASEYMERGMANLSAAVTKKVGQFAAQAKDAFQAGDSMFGSQGPGIDASEMVGGMAGEAGSQNLAARGVKWMRKNVVDKSPTLQRVDKRLQKFARNAPRELADKQREIAAKGDDGTISGSIMSFIAKAFGPQINKQDVGVMKGDSLMSPHDITFKTINEIMPGYMSRMLNELFLIRTGQKEGNEEGQERKIFDYDKNDFVKRGDLKKDLQQKFVGDEDVKSFDKLNEELLETIGAKQLSTEAQKSLREGLMKASADNHVGNKENLTNRKIFAGSGEAGDQDKASKHMDDFFAQHGTDPAKMKEFEILYNKLVESLKNPRPQATKHAMLGQGDILKELGYLDDDHKFTSHGVLEDYKKRLSTPVQKEKEAKKKGQQAVVEDLREYENLGDEIKETFIDLAHEIPDAVRNLTDGINAAGNKLVDWVSNMTLDSLRQAAIAKAEDTKLMVQGLVSDKARYDHLSKKTPEDLDEEDLAWLKEYRAAKRKTDGARVEPPTPTATPPVVVPPTVNPPTGTPPAPPAGGPANPPDPTVIVDPPVNPEPPPVDNEVEKNNKRYKDIAKIRVDQRSPEDVQWYKQEMARRKAAKKTKPGATPPEGGPVNPDTPPPTPPTPDRAFAKGGIFGSLKQLSNKVFDNKEFFNFVEDGLRKVGVLGEAGKEAVMPASGGGVQAVDTQGNPQGKLPLTRDNSGRLSVELDPSKQKDSSQKAGASAEKNTNQVIDVIKDGVERVSDDIKYGFKPNLPKQRPKSNRVYTSKLEEIIHNEWDDIMHEDLHFLKKAKLTHKLRARLEMEGKGTREEIDKIVAPLVKRDFETPPKPKAVAQPPKGEQAKPQQVVTHNSNLDAAIQALETSNKNVSIDQVKAEVKELDRTDNLSNGSSVKLITEETTKIIKGIGDEGKKLVDQLLTATEPVTASSVFGALSKGFLTVVDKINDIIPTPPSLKEAAPGMAAQPQPAAIAPEVTAPLSYAEIREQIKKEIDKLRDQINGTGTMDAKVAAFNGNPLVGNGQSPVVQGAAVSSNSVPPPVEVVSEETPEQKQERIKAKQRETRKNNQETKAKQKQIWFAKLNRLAEEGDVFDLGCEIIDLEKEQKIVFTSTETKLLKDLASKRANKKPLTDGDRLVFSNGKIIKRSTLLKKQKQGEAVEEAQPVQPVEEKPTGLFGRIKASVGKVVDKINEAVPTPPSMQPAQGQAVQTVGDTAQVEGGKPSKLEELLQRQFDKIVGKSENGEQSSVAIGKLMKKLEEKGIGSRQDIEKHIFALIEKHNTLASKANAGFKAVVGDENHAAATKAFGLAKSTVTDVVGGVYDKAKAAGQSVLDAGKQPELVGPVQPSKLERLVDKHFKKIISKSGDGEQAATTLGNLVRQLEERGLGSREEIEKLINGLVDTHNNLSAKINGGAKDLLGDERHAQLGKGFGIAKSTLSQVASGLYNKTKQTGQSVLDSAQKAFEPDTSGMTIGSVLSLQEARVGELIKENSDILTPEELGKFSEFNTERAKEYMAQNGKPETAQDTLKFAKTMFDEVEEYLINLRSSKQGLVGKVAGEMRKAKRKGHDWGASAVSALGGAISKQYERAGAESELVKQYQDRVSVLYQQLQDEAAEISDKEGFGSFIDLAFGKIGKLGDTIFGAVKSAGESAQSFIHNATSSSGENGEQARASGNGSGGNRDLLEEIRDSLFSIEELLDERGGDTSKKKWYNPLSWGKKGDGEQASTPQTEEEIAEAQKKKGERRTTRIANAAKRGKEKAVNFGGGVAGAVGNLASGATNMVGGAIKGTLGATAFVAKKQVEAISWVGKSAYNWFKEPLDVYVEGEKKPRLYGKLFEKGEYIKLNSKKVAKDHNDVTEPIVDKKGQILISEEDLTKLFTKGIGARAYRLGKGVLGMAGKLAGGVLNAFLGTAKIVPAAAELMWNMTTGAARFGKKLYDKLGDGPADVYTPGVKDPVMTKSVMKMGGYISKSTGKPIMRPTEIDGAVLDLDKNEVLTLEQFRRGIFNKDGNKFKTPLDKVANVLIKAGGGILRAQKAAWEGTKMIASGMLKGIKGLGNFALGGFSLEINGTKTRIVMEEIRDLLKEYFDTKPHRSKKKREEEALKKKELKEKEKADKEKIKEEKAKEKERLKEEAKKRQKAFGDSDGDGDRENSWQDRLSKKVAEQKEKIKDAGAKAKDKLTEKAPGMMDMFSKVKGFLGGAADTAGDAKDLAKGAGKLGMGAKLLGWGRTGLSALGIGGAAVQALGGAGALASGTAAATGAAATGATAIGAAGTTAAATGAAATGITATGAAGTAAAGAGAFISLPVVLTALGIAAVGYGGYKLYQWAKSYDLTTLDNLRLVQYGFPYGDKKAFNKVASLEKLVFENMSSKGYIEDKNINVKDLLSIFDIDEKDRGDVAKLMNWYTRRFKPVVSNTVMVIEEATGKGGKNAIGSIPSLTGEEAAIYINKANPDQGVYGIEVPGKPGDFQGSEAVKRAKDQIRKEMKLDELKEGSKDKSGGQATKAVAVGAAVATAAKTGEVKEGEKKTDPKVPNTGFWGKSVDLIAGGATLAFMPANTVMTLGGVVVGGWGSLGRKMLRGLAGIKLRPIDKIRLVQYGYKSDDTRAFKVIRRLEEMCVDHVTNQQGKFSIDSKKIPWDDVFYNFEIPSSGKEAELKQGILLEWFKQRFQPVFFNHLNAAQQGLSLDNPKTCLDKILDAEREQLNAYLKALSIDDKVYSGKTLKNIFDEYPQQGKAEVEAVIKEVRAELKLDENDGKNDNFTTSQQIAIGAKAALDSAKDLFGKAKQKLKDAYKGAKAFASEKLDKVKKIGTEFYDKIASGIGAAFEKGKDLVKKGVSFLGEKLLAALSKPVAIVTEAIEDIKDFGSSIFNFGLNAIRGVVGTKIDTIEMLRLVQYGFADFDGDGFNSIDNLEKLCAKHVKQDGDKFSIDAKKLDWRKVMKLFNIQEDEDAPKKHESLIEWFKYRFQPVYFKNLLAAKTVLGDADFKNCFSKLKNAKQEVQLQYLNLAKFDDGPYDRYRPMSCNQAYSHQGSKEVKAVIDKIKSKLKLGDETKPKAAGAAATLPEEAKTVAKKAAMVSAKTPDAVVKEVAGGGITASGVAKMDPALVQDGAEYLDQTTLSQLVDLANLKQDGKVTALEAVYYRALGLKDLDQSKIKAIKALQKKVNSKINFANGEVNWTGSPSELIKELSGEFGIIELGGEDSANWMAWFTNRFIPVHLKLYSLYCAYTGNKKIGQDFGALKVSQQFDIAKQIAAMSVWKLDKSPWPGLAMNSEAKSVEDNLKFLEETIKKETAIEEKAKLAQKSAPAPSKANTPEEQDKLYAQQTKEMEKRLKAEAVANGSNPDSEPKPSQAGAVAAAPVAGGSTSAAGLKLASGERLDGSGGVSSMSLGKGVDIDGLNPAVKKLFFGMSTEYEKLTGKKITVNDGFRSYADQVRMKEKYGSRAATPGTSLHGYGIAIDANSADLNKADDLGLMRKYGFTRPLGQEPWHMEPIGIQFDLDKYKKNPELAQQATMEGVGKGGGGYGTVSGAKEVARNTELSKSIFGSTVAPVDPKVAGKKDDKPSVGAPAQLAPNEPVAEKSTLLTAPAPKPNAAPPGGAVPPGAPPAQSSSGKGKSESAIPPDKEPKPPAVPTPQGKSEKDALKAGDKSIVTEPKENQNATTASTPSQAKLASVPKSDGTLGGVVKTVEKAAETVGIKPDVAKSVVAIESGFNANAKSGASSASGLYQFVNDTWNAVLKQYGKPYGYFPGQTSPFDPQANAIMGAHYLKENETSLKRNGESQVDATDLYTAHFLGAGGANTFLRGLRENPNQPAATILPKAAGSNKEIFYDIQRPRNVAEVRRLLESKVQTKAASFGLKVQNDPMAPAPTSKQPSDQSTAGQTKTASAQTGAYPQTSAQQPTASAGTFAGMNRESFMQRMSMTSDEVNGKVPAAYNSETSKQAPEVSKPAVEKTVEQELKPVTPPKELPQAARFSNSDVDQNQAVAMMQKENALPGAHMRKTEGILTEHLRVTKSMSDTIGMIEKNLGVMTKLIASKQTPEKTEKPKPGDNTGINEAVDKGKGNQEFTGKRTTTLAAMPKWEISTSRNV